MISTTTLSKFLFPLICISAVLVSYARTVSPNPIVLKPQEVKIEEIDKGDVMSHRAKEGDTVAIHYTGKLMDGTKFDSSLDRNQPLEFTLGKHQVVAGFEQGVTGMHVGGKRIVQIPPQLGYGSRAVGPIPANSTLIFEIELVEVKH
jgi:FKBP-type peptidyl-prolyl cis-trans isomerase